MTDTASPETPTTPETQNPEILRLTRLIHWMYGLHALGVGLGLVTAGLCFAQAFLVPYLIGVAIFALWPSLVADWLYRRNKKASLITPLTATHFENINSIFWTCVVWTGTFIVLWFILTGLFFHGALVIMGLYSSLRSAYCWLMFNHGQPIARKQKRRG